MGRPPANKGPQAAAPSGEPNKPEGLSAIASQEWDALVEELQQLGTLSTVDRATIEMAARYAGYFAEAAEDVRENGLTLETKTGSKSNPSIRSRDDSARIRKSYLESLGLTPASRSRVAKPVGSDSEDSLESILRGGDDSPAARDRSYEATHGGAKRPKK
jgi:P27 family predicted phage terminase small subunit